MIYYRPLKEEPSSSGKSSGTSSSHSSRKGKGSSGKSTSRRKGDELWNGKCHLLLLGIFHLLVLFLEGATPSVQSPLQPFLTARLPESVTIQDASLEALCLLRILNAVNCYWTHLYPGHDFSHIIPPTEFLNSKIAAKVCFTSFHSKLKAMLNLRILIYEN